MTQFEDSHLLQLSHEEIDRHIGLCVQQYGFFAEDGNKDPSEIGRSWFIKNKEALKKYARNNPQLKDFFNKDRQEQLEVIAAVGDLAIASMSGIPILLVVVKISQYGYNRLVDDREDDGL